MKPMHNAAALMLGALALSGCSSGPSKAELDQRTAAVVASSFQAKGIATLDRLHQDEANRLCAQAQVDGKPLDDASARAIEAAQFKTIQWPADGRYLGDWKEGEKIAQNGRGLTWNDKAGAVNGGNCYNCHQISKAEISFGTIGPSLYHYGKLRGVSDPDSAAAREIVTYTWGKIWNPRAYNACSNMPRVGHNGILDATQIRHVMALLLDPASPVNSQ